MSRATGEPLPNPRVISNRIAWALGHKLNNNKPPDDLSNVNFSKSLKIELFQKFYEVNILFTFLADSLLTLLLGDVYTILYSY